MLDVRTFVRANAMPLVAVAAALTTCVLVPPDAAYAGYIDWGTLGKLACMLLAVGGCASRGCSRRLPCAWCPAAGACAP